MSELQHYYSEVACGGAWQDRDPEHCGCNGNGWFLSQVDTWHRCSFHGRNVPHPEDYTDGELTDEEYEGRVAAVLAELEREGVNFGSPASSLPVNDFADDFDDIPF